MRQQKDHDDSNISLSSLCQLLDLGKALSGLIIIKCISRLIKWGGGEVGGHYMMQARTMPMLSMFAFTKYWPSLGIKNGQISI